MKGRRLVLKQALAPDEVDKLGESVKPGDKKAQRSQEKNQWSHLLNVGAISETSEKWQQLSKSEQRQRLDSAKERKFRINNPNWMLDPLRLSIRNLPRTVDAVKLREVVLKHLGEQLAPEGTPKKKKMKIATAAIAKVQLVRDSERKTLVGERRSKGFGFLAFTEHKAAMATLALLNDNPALFGGGKRPIVEFAVEDKRKLRMQRELYTKHAHKLQPEPKANAEGAEAERADGKPAWWKDHKKKKKEGFSRGRMQREKRRAAKTAESEKGERQDMTKQRHHAVQARKREDKTATRELNRKPKRKNLPDALETSAKKAKKNKVGQLPDDFELQTMEKYRRNGR